MNQKVLFIIPAYNEEENILRTVKSIHNYNPKWDVLVINDGSKDNTSNICKENKIPVVDLVMNLGIGGAVQTGYIYAYRNGYDIAIQFDGDGQHEVSSADNLIQPILNNEADFVIGSRFVDKQRDNFQSSFMRRIGIRMISATIWLLSGRPVLDPTSGYRAANKEVIEFLALNYPTEFPEPESNLMLNKKHVRIKEVFAQMHERQAGSSSIHTWISVYYMVNVLFSLFITSLRKFD